MSDADVAAKLRDEGKITSSEYATWVYAEERARAKDNPNAVETAVAPLTDQQIAENSKVADLIKKHNDAMNGPPPPYTPPAMNAEHPDKKPKLPVTDGMPPPVRTTSEKNDVVVSIEALKQFDKNVASLLPFVDSTHNSLEQVYIMPGNFGAGVKLRDDVHVTLLPSSLDFLKKVADTFLHLRTDIGELILEYETAEEWNKLDAQRLNEVFKKTFDDIGNYQKVDPANSAGPTPSPSKAV